MLTGTPPLALATPESGCPAANGYDMPADQLENLATAVKSGKPVDVLALGSASAVSQGKSGYLQAAVDALRTALPRVTFSLAVHARHGMTADEMLALLRTALAHKHYPLVLWQTGTVEAVQAIRPEDFGATLQEGADLVTAQQGNLVLIDFQFSRFLHGNTDLTPYEQTLDAAAAAPGVDFFHRFDLMHHWVQEGQIDLERTPKEQLESIVGRLNHCLGLALAHFLLEGISPGDH